MGKDQKVMAFGTFDGIHKGHHYYLDKAKGSAKKLVVVVARDKTVNDIKGRPPKKDEKTRLDDVNKLEGVDEAVLGNLDDPYRVIEEHRPDIIALGHDQVTFVDKLVTELEKRKIDAKVKRVLPFKREIYRSSLL